MDEVSSPINGVNDPGWLISELTLHPIRHRLFTNEPITQQYLFIIIYHKYYYTNTVIIQLP